MRLKQAEELEIEEIKSVLSSRDSDEYPVCRHYDDQSVFTFGCTIMVLSGGKSIGGNIFSARPLIPSSSTKRAVTISSA
jgi:hypothetical protein